MFDRRTLASDLTLLAYRRAVGVFCTVRPPDFARIPRLISNTIYKHSLHAAKEAVDTGWRM